MPQTKPVPSCGEHLQKKQEYNLISGYFLELDQFSNASKDVLVVVLL